MYFVSCIMNLLVMNLLEINAIYKHPAVYKHPRDNSRGSRECRTPLRHNLSEQRLFFDYVRLERRSSALLCCASATVPHFVGPVSPGLYHPKAYHLAKNCVRDELALPHGPYNAGNFFLQQSSLCLLVRHFSHMHILFLLNKF